MLVFIRQNFRWIGGAFLLTLFSSFGQTFFISVSKFQWIERFAMSDGGFARLYMFATLGSAATLPFLGRLIDIWPASRVILLSAPLLALGCVAAAYAPNVAILFAAIYLLRLFGQGMMIHIALTQIGRWFRARRGRAVSVSILGIQTGEAILPLSYAALALSVGWQTVWAMGAGLIVLVALPLATWAFAVDRTPEGQLPDGTAPVPDWTAGEVIRDPVFWVLLTGVLAPPFIGTTLFFNQNDFAELRGWSPVIYGTAFTLTAFTTIIVALIAGGLIDRFGSKTLLPIFLLPLAGACIVAAEVEAIWGLYGFMVLFGITTGFSNTLFGALWPEIYGTAHLGAIRSMMMPFLVLSSALGPGISGTLMDMGVGLESQFRAMAIYSVVVIAVILPVSRTLVRRARRQGHRAADPAAP